MRHTRIIATYDFHFGHGNDEQIVRRGDDILCPGTGVMSAADQARSLIATGAAVEADSKAAQRILKEC